MPPEAAPAARGGQAALQAAFRAGIWSAEVPAGLTAPDPAEVAARFAVYRNNVAVGLRRAQAARYPAVERLVGAEFFAAAARLFAVRHPTMRCWPRCWPAAPWVRCRAIRPLF